jgi:hypothetical protein
MMIIGMHNSRRLRKFSLLLNKEMLSKEAQLSSSKAKQTVLDLTSPAKRTVTGEMKRLESKTLDSTIASFFYENALAFNVAGAPIYMHTANGAARTAASGCAQ